VNYQDIISIEPGKRGGRPCIRHMRIAVADVLGWLAAGQTHQQILGDFPELTEDDIRRRQDAVFAQDRAIVETQHPERIPIDLKEELHVRSDRLAVEYRRWLKELGVTYGTFGD